ncbi:hypothetical protein SD70_30420 [Gordoniibacillus kamchatkensis]|uniref:Peptidase C45 hydrolase domain-containing protein n=1 Tax=Gordoniibacillus kamchatkensis TaxID=1590651 RepID=A0ABR5AAG0_9BACL|nr:C45 family peptidase [Paenibacillus sp. VKM B-2647]KIL37823.1 hypothetical protein SD70_30420 [Paenibacillus sp. VKM B-2647]
MERQNVTEEQKADYQYYEASGTPYEIGRITAQKGGSLLGIEGQLSAEQRKFAEQCRDIVQRIYPEMMEEFAGYAAALQLEENDLLWHYTLGVEGGCSGIAVQLPEGIVVARNYDFYYFENRRHLIYTRPDRGYAHIGMHEGLIGGRFDGLNEKGLYVSFNGAGQHPDPAVPGISFHLIVRYLLEKCADAKEAKEFLLSVPVKEAKSYFVVDQTEAFVAEVHPENRAIREMQNGLLVVTNHFVHPAMSAYQKQWANSVARYQTLETFGEKIRSNHSDWFDTLQDAMKDHAAPVCGHVDGLATFWSCIANTKTGDVFYSFGPVQESIQAIFSLWRL